VHIARTIKQYLEIKGYKGRVFFDYSELSNEDFDKRILSVIRQAKVFISVLTPDSMLRCVNDGDWVRRELLEAYNNKLQMIFINPDGREIAFPGGFPEELSFVKTRNHLTVHMDSSFERDMDDLIEKHIAPVSAPSDGSNSGKYAKVRVRTDHDCVIKRFDEEIGSAKVGEYSIVYLPKGKHRITFMANDAEAAALGVSVTQMFEVRDVDYEDYIEVSLKDVYDKRLKDLAISKAVKSAAKKRKGFQELIDEGQVAMLRDNQLREKRIKKWTIYAVVAILAVVVGVFIWGGDDMSGSKPNPDEPVIIVKDSVNLEATAAEEVANVKIKEDSNVKDKSSKDKASEKTQEQVVEKKSETAPVKKSEREKQKVGTIVIQSKPSGASVKIDGRDYGVTPLTLNNMLIGSYNVVISKKGYHSQNRTIKINEGKIIEENVALVAVKSQSSTAESFSAQKEKIFAISEFVKVPFDMSGRGNTTEKFDANGDRYAIVKVISDDSKDNLADYRFDFGIYSSRKEMVDGELWLYVQKNAKQVSVSREGFKTINRFNLGCVLESGAVYRMTISKKTEVVTGSKYGTINGHEYVDLGLPSGLKWATCNVGADSPEEYGDYYAWGEIETKSEYTEDNSKTRGKSISDISGNAMYDVACAKWGGSWRLPTKEEFNELRQKCKWQWTTQNGKRGCKVTGPNGNSIFLPVAGYRRWSSLYYAGEDGCYWSSTPGESNDSRAYYLSFVSSGHDLCWYNRYFGQSVRPVSK
ncbi:MAG: PEGA domain-containing protein, partial [Bacteroidales bacterium]|nr:PEGA domain-containing protein [Bacteroidales bacterium]